MTTAIRVEFSRTCDARDAFATVCEHLDGARLGESAIEVDCTEAEENRVVEELELALDEWLVQHELPFAPIPAGPHTLVVRPPGD
jgi:hypothetical protein